MILVLVLAAGCGGPAGESVVIYTSQDQEYAEPILRQFERETGIHARAAYDNESVKTMGLVNRLRAEQPHPQCDVFWSNEAMLAATLAREKMFRESNGWVSVGFRSRRIVINTRRVQPAAQSPPSGSKDSPTSRSLKPPESLLELTNAVWRRQVALAYPLFGTTASHFVALREKWGDALWQRWCRALAANQPFLLDGNSVVVNLVGRGEAAVGLTDSDDIAAGRREKWPVASLPISSETLLIPNTIGVLRNAPHPMAAEKLFAYLQQPRVLQQLVAAHALEGISTNEVAVQTLPVDWLQLSARFAETSRELQQIFLR